ncbi:MAG: bifunctional methylenetetrahydrofolate dehydrogenase/methenyltetrahydrofolate cyclohydrolase FolD [Gemmatimonadota bacterium]|nr:MAG: bifunctional methylenetetrahydrofolate dehydrogenase/methenyltetrahydrofolate cyclohydrolase FolD [Gemmatimonadota bacterium]
MHAKIIDGKQIAEEMRADLSQEIEALRQSGVTPGLAVVLVGEDPASQVYVRMKGKACEKIGIYSETIKLPEETTEEGLLAEIDRLNNDEKIHGFLVQLPLPKQINSRNVLLAIMPEKDVDGFHPVNVGKIAAGDTTGFPPATPFGVQQMLIRSGVEISGAHAVIVGRSNIVGKPMASLLVQKADGANATTTICHSRTKNLPEITRQGDILIAAMGVPEFVKADMIKPGAVVIDVGTNRVDDPSTEKGYRLVGDVDFEKAKEVASAITPVPGGVGPMTITMLLYNTVQAAKQWAGA